MSTSMPLTLVLDVTVTPIEAVDPGLTELGTMTLAEYDPTATDGEVDPELGLVVEPEPIGKARATA